MFVIQLILFQAFIFIILVVALRYVMSKNVTKATAHLQHLSEEYIKKEEALRRKYAELKDKYTETVDQAKKEAFEILDKAHVEGKGEATRIIEQAHKKSEQIMKQAKSCEERMKKEMNEAIKKEAVNEAYALLDRVLPEETRRNMHARWTKELIADGFKSSKKMKIPENIKEAEVASPYKLTQQEMNSIQKELKKYLGHDVRMKETIDHKLIAGVVITVGSVVLNGSLFFKVKEMADLKNNEG